MPFSDSINKIILNYDYEGILESLLCEYLSLELLTWFIDRLSDNEQKYKTMISMIVKYYRNEDLIVLQYLRTKITDKLSFRQGFFRACYHNQLNAINWMLDEMKFTKHELFMRDDYNKCKIVEGFDEKRPLEPVCMGDICNGSSLTVVELLHSKLDLVGNDYIDTYHDCLHTYDGITNKKYRTLKWLMDKKMIESNRVYLLTDRYPMQLSAFIFCVVLFCTYLCSHADLTRFIFSR